MDESAALEKLRTDTPLWGREVGKIVNKQRQRVPFVLNEGQLAFDKEVEAQRSAGKPMRAIVLKARQIGFCLDPSTRVLTADLRWVEIDSLQPGDELVATDEDVPGGRGRGRKFRRGVVEVKADRHASGFKLTMDDGRELRATGQHRFLCKKRGATDTVWRAVETMKEGEQIRYVADPWQGDATFEDGWFAGIIDGEGHFRKKTGHELTVTQCLGPVFDRAETYLRERGYSYRKELRKPEAGRKPCGKLVVSRTNELLRLMGETRPSRFAQGWWEGTDLPGKRTGKAWSRVVKIEPLGPQRFVDIQTSTKTFIAEGYVSHNSTYIQGKLIQRATMTANYHTAVVAHDRETGAKLYRIGQHFYSHLPAEIKPEIASFRRSQYLHFAERGDAWMEGERWPDSTYYVDTASETDAGRGGTFAAIHGSEVAFWPDLITKLTALQAAVPDDPETMLFLESTANGHNEFKDFWDDAVEGRNDYIPFFWPWHKEATYTMPFSSEQEREAFIVGDGPYGEDEQALIDTYSLTIEQLHWRRYTIANKTAGRLDKFKQEYPANAEEAFLTTGHRVFDPQVVNGILVTCDLTDPRTPDQDNPGPEKGTLRATQQRMVASSRGGLIERPEEPEWSPDPTGRWRLWHPREDAFFTPPPDKRYVIGVDVSGGEFKSTVEPAYNAINVIDHETREQIATYRSREDDMILAAECYMAGMFFNGAWLAVEITGGWGLPVARRLALDYGYPFVYHRERLDNMRGKEQDTLGWNTDSRTKPLLVAKAQEILRDGTHGVRSRVLAQEMLTFIRTETGKTEPEPGKYSDLLMAWMISHLVADLMPLRRPATATRAPKRRARNPITGY